MLLSQGKKLTERGRYQNIYIKNSVIIHTKETRIERDTCTPIFIVALFPIARTWKQPRCPPADEWIRKLWYIYTMEYYSVIKKNTFESVPMRRMKLELLIQIQKEVHPKEKHQYSILMHVYVCVCVRVCVLKYRKTVTTTLYAKQQKRHRCKEQTSGLCARRQEWDDLRE